MNKLLISLGTLAMACHFNLALAAGWHYDNNRIAISADGNNQPDNHHFWQCH
ncbi:hypothetical protein [Saccharobesus litoralis]|uniref:hypothetical protein n=1 Tax=Saccharobesus litoralis TaxID=2172099 RepID=UPI00131EEE60|nr:hypothetical protein [Saccharobesus litoralis]